MTLEIITSDRLAPFRHGFFTRRGGASSGIYKGLNCGYGSGDQTDMVTINRGRVSEAMQVPPQSLLTLYQVHSTEIVHVTGAMNSGQIRADGFVTCTPGVAISVLSADCQPVLFADRQAGVIAAAHAGWKGALAGILEATITAMEKLGAQRDNINAVIGPCISQPAYEVGPEFRQKFRDCTPAHDRFFAPGTGDRSMFNLPAFGLHLLDKAGIAQAEWTGHCTHGDASRFYSYRRATQQRQGDYGRLIASICL